jgi:hypothetical protein
MGVLDDAIREHLELKRRHGASDEEIAQKEAEALGPARRDFPVPQQAEPDAEPHVDAAPDAEPEPAHEPEPLVDPLPADPLAKETVAPTVIDEPALEPEPEQALKPEPEHEPEPESEHEPEPEPAPFEDAPAAEEEDPEPEPSTADEDVLEETPEFLQDAPEHDRLWFEQKPPRDFDFD